MTSLQILFLAIILDYFLGDPPQIWRRYPHPAVLMGRVVGFLENILNRGGLRLVKGVVTTVVIVVLAFLIGYIIRQLPDFGFGPIGLIYDIIELALVFLALLGGVEAPIEIPHLGPLIVPIG